MLEQALSLLSAPGEYTRGLLAGTPGERVGGRELLRALGLVGEEDTWGNFLAGMGTDIATDPLTYAGALLGGAGGAAAARGVRGLIPAETAALGKAVGPGPANVLGAGARFKGPLYGTAMLTDLHVADPRVRAMVEAATAKGLPAEQLAIDAGLGQWLPRSATPGTVRVPLDDTREVVGNLTPRTLTRFDRADAEARFRGLVGRMPENIDDVDAAYSPFQDMLATTGPSLAGRSGRHERVHALIANSSRAGRGGYSGNLPPLMRWPAELQQSHNPILNSLGVVADELAAHALENRTTAGKLAGAARFLFNPGRNAAYAERFAEDLPAPLVAAAYGYLPQGLVHAGAGAGLGGASGNYLLQRLAGGG